MAVHSIIVSGGTPVEVLFLRRTMRRGSSYMRLHSTYFNQISDLLSYEIVLISTQVTYIVAKGSLSRQQAARRKSGVL